MNDVRASTPYYLYLFKLMRVPPVLVAVHQLIIRWEYERSSNGQYRPFCRTSYSVVAVGVRQGQ